MFFFAEFCRYFSQDIIFDFGPEAACVVYGCAWSVPSNVLEGVATELSKIRTDKELLQVKAISEASSDGYILLSDAHLREDIHMILTTIRLYLKNQPSTLFELNQQIESLRRET